MLRGLSSGRMAVLPGIICGDHARFTSAPPWRLSEASSGHLFQLTFISHRWNTDPFGSRPCHIATALWRVGHSGVRYGRKGITQPYTSLDNVRLVTKTGARQLGIATKRITTIS